MWQSASLFRRLCTKGQVWSFKLSEDQLTLQTNGFSSDHKLTSNFNLQILQTWLLAWSSSLMVKSITLFAHKLLFPSLTGFTWLACWMSCGVLMGLAQSSKETSSKEMMDMNVFKSPVLCTYLVRWGLGTNEDASWFPETVKKTLELALWWKRCLILAATKHWTQWKQWHFLKIFLADYGTAKIH